MKSICPKSPSLLNPCVSVTLWAAWAGELPTFFADNLPPSEMNTNISGSSVPLCHCNNVDGTRECTAWIRFHVIYQTVFNNTSWTKTVHQHADMMPNSKMNTCSSLFSWRESFLILGDKHISEDNSVFFIVHVWCLRGSLCLLPPKYFLEHLNQRMTGTVWGPTGRKNGSKRVSGTLWMQKQKARGPRHSAHGACLCCAAVWGSRFGSGQAVWVWRIELVWMFVQGNGWQQGRKC